MNRATRHRSTATLVTVAVFLFTVASSAGRAQSLAVLPVNVFLSPGQSAAALTITNQGTRESSIQIRAYAWNQNDSGDQLDPTDAVVVSPPIATIPAGATQVVRLILRRAAQAQEATYRILLDQIPPPAEPGVVHVVLRLSIPIFAEPVARANAHLQFHLEYEAGEAYLVGVNDGLRHEAIRDIAVVMSDGTTLKADSGISPYILAGVTRRWRLVVPASTQMTSDSLRLTAHADSGPIEQQVHVVVKH